MTSAFGISSSAHRKASRATLRTARMARGPRGGMLVRVVSPRTMYRAWQKAHIASTEALSTSALSEKLKATSASSLAARSANAGNVRTNCTKAWQHPMATCSSFNCAMAFVTACKNCSSLHDCKFQLSMYFFMASSQKVSATTLGSSAGNNRWSSAMAWESFSSVPVHTKSRGSRVGHVLAESHLLSDSASSRKVFLTTISRRGNSSAFAGGPCSAPSGASSHQSASCSTLAASLRPPPLAPCSGSSVVSPASLGLLCCTPLSPRLLRCRLL
mmetsp:Transcript_91557/g.263488  ORF Transcript_91557/g.263488 Transcript_91557/m.263488 type:complete len:272 (-) Transcript_91557:803-1618(-)